MGRALIRRYGQGRMNQSGKYWSLALLVLGGCLFMFGVTMLTLMPMLTERMINEEIPLRKGNFIQRIWRDPPYTITMQFWIFNVTNPDQIVNRGEKPNLVQKGPYGYKEFQHKKKVKYLEDGSISYVNHKVYYFDPALSCPTCRLDDIFTVPNIPYLTGLRTVEQLYPASNNYLFNTVGKAVLMGMGKQLFISNITAGQLIFDGYDDEILQFGKIYTPDDAPDKMGILYGKNNTDDGAYVIHSGIKNVSNIGRIIAWQGHTDLSFKKWWNTKHANMISGSDGTLYSPFLKRTDTLDTFTSEICRSVQLDYSNDVDFHGVKAYQFRVSQRSFDAFAPENYGFCVPSKQPIYHTSVQPKVNGGWCLPSGMYDISKCQYGAPIVASMPQFVFAPKEVLNSVVGLFDPSDDYLSNVILEPTTGVLLQGMRTVQLNVLMQPQPEDERTNRMRPTLIPLIWINESAVIDPPTRTYIYQNVVILRKSAFLAAYISLGLGIVWMVCVCIGFSMCKSRGDEQDLVRLLK